ncbi:MAG: fatty acid desaturase family protein [Halioglobus sp.]|nr:fatty acid desaturase family protein [Halioglobus sp.]
MKVSDYVSSEEVAYFTTKSDWQGWRLVLGNWLCIAAIFALVGVWSTPVIIILAVVLLASRQLALSVMMHDCGHRNLFRSKRLNAVVGQWLCALPVMSDQPSYARGHLEHHTKSGSIDDPDLSNYQSYPVSRSSFKRKVIRDLSGQTGFKSMSFIARGAAGALSNKKRASAAPLVKQLGVQLVLFAILTACGIGWTFLLWVLAYMTVFMLIIRIRQVAEHAAVPDLFDQDPRMNTRTVDAPWWQRMILAPCGVNYHLEHHFMASVPSYKLRELRQHLRRRHALDDVPQFDGYGAVLRHAVSA